MPNPFKFGSIDYDNWNYEHPQEAAGAEDELSRAKLALADADAFAMNSGSERLANLPASLAALRTPEDKRGLARRITEPLASVGGAATLASLPAMVNPVIGGALATGGGLAQVPDYLRRLIAPEEGEAAPGAFETGGIALAALPAMRGLKSLAAEARPFIGPLGDEIGAAGLGGRALAYEGGAGVRPAERAVASPIDKLLASESFANLPRGAVSKAKAKPTVPRSVFQQMSDAGEFTGDRTTGQFTEGPGGLSSLAKKAPPQRPSAGSIMQDMEENYGHGLRPNPWSEVPLPESLQMDPMQRLAARSAERFGKKYRKE